MKLYSADWLLPVLSPPMRDGAMVVDADHIFELAPKKYLEEKYKNIPHKHFKNAVILPGFVNTHCHLLHAFEPGAPRDFAAWYAKMVEKAQSQNQVDWKKQTKKSLKELIRSGVTTVADSGPQPGVIPYLKKSGLRGIFYQEIFGFLEPDLDHWKNYLTEQKMHSRLRYGYAPHSPYTMPTEMFRTISRYSAEVKTPVTTHLAESKEENLFFEQGNGALSKIFPGRENEIPRSRSSVQYMHDQKILGPHLLAAHCVHVSERDIDLLVKNRVRIAYCPTSNQYLNVGSAPVKTYLYRQLAVGLGTDSAATTGSLNYFQTLRDAALLGGLKPEEVMRMATLGGAKALGLDKETGSLQRNKQADWIAVKLRDPVQKSAEIYAQLVYKAQPKDLIYSMVDGKVLIKK